MSDHDSQAPDRASVSAYVDAALALHFPALSEAAAARVHEQFARIAMLAAPVLAYAAQRRRRTRAGVSAMTSARFPLDALGIARGFARGDFTAREVVEDDASAASSPATVM